jgi:hypothetical protein
MNDLDRVRQRQRERVLEEAALDREAWAWYREALVTVVYAMPETILLGGPFSVQALRASESAGD